MCQYGTVTHKNPFRVGRTVTDFAQCIADRISCNNRATHSVKHSPTVKKSLLTSFEKFIAGIDQDSSFAGSDSFGKRRAQPRT
jgi:hypothetical protein